MAKPLLSLLLLLLVAHAGFSQRKHSRKFPITREMELESDRHFRCSRTDRYNADQRRAFFPFSKADTVKLISFEPFAGPEPDVHPKVKEDTALNDTVPLFTPLAPGLYAINHRKVKEIKTMTLASIDSLTDILYNVGYTPVKNLRLELTPTRGYYTPQNAILFINQKGQITEYIELCFSCQWYYYSSSKMKEVEYCEQKYDMLKNFFLVSGIKYVERPQVADNEN